MGRPLALPDHRAVGELIPSVNAANVLLLIIGVALLAGGLGYTLVL